MRITAHTAFALSALIALAGCTREVNEKYFKDPWPSTRTGAAQTPTDCSSYTKAEPASFASAPIGQRQRLLLRFQYHYNLLEPRLLRQEAVQILTRSSGTFGKSGSKSDGIVTRFPEHAIPVFIYSKDSSNIARSKTAIERINNVFRDIAETRLSVHTIASEENTPPWYWASTTGIHLYFGSKECLWRVLDEQADVDRDEITSAATINLENLGGLTVTQTILRDGIRTGQIHRSIVVVLNVPDGPHKQGVIEHELIHALGVKGHANHVLWSRMSQVAESVAPLARPSGFDRELLRILYAKLSPGDSAERVSEIIAEAWRFEANRESRNTPICVRELGYRQNNGETIEGVELIKGVICDLGLKVTDTK